MPIKMNIIEEKDMSTEQILARPDVPFRPSPKAKEVMIPPSDITEQEILLRQFRRAKQEREKDVSAATGKIPFDPAPAGPAEAQKVIETIEARDKIGGAIGAGVIRTAGDIYSGLINTIIGVANVPLTLATLPFGAPGKTTSFVGRSDSPETAITKPVQTFENKKYLDFYNKRREEGDGFFSSVAKTTAKLFKESPEPAKDGTEIVTSLINADKQIVTQRDVSTTTAFFRPEASAFERITRLMPELFVNYKISKGLSTRGGKRQINRAIDLAKQRYKNNPAKLKEIDQKGILALTNDEMLGDLVTDINRTFKNDYGKGLSGFLNTAKNIRNDRPIARFFIRGSIPKIGPALAARGRAKLAERAAFNIGEKRKELQKIIDKQSGITPNTTLLERVQGIPKIKKNIAATEAGAALGLLTASSIFSDNGDPGTLIGVGASVVGGGIAGVGYEVARNVIKHGYSATGAALFDIADALQIEGFESFARKVDLSPEKTTAAKYFVLHMKSLPDEQRKAAIENIVYFGELKKTLIKQGVDEKFLHSTIGKVTGLTGVLQLQESLGNYMAQSRKALGSKSLSNTLQELEQMIGQQTFAVKSVSELRKVLDELSEKTLGLQETDTKYKTFIDALKKDAIRTQVFINQNSNSFNRSLDKLEEVIGNPSLSSNKKRDQINELRQALLKSEAIRPRSRIDQDIDDPSLGQQVVGTAVREATREVKKEIGKTDQFAKRESQLLSGFKQFFGSENQQVTTENAVSDFVEKARITLLERKKEASDLFESIKGTDVDITDWFAGLYGQNIKLAKNKKEALLQRLSGSTTVDDNVLKSLESVFVRESMVKFIKNNPEMLNHVKTAVGEKDELETVNDVFTALVKFSKKDDLTDIDLLFGLRQIAEDNNVNPSGLRIMIDTENVMSVTSALNSKAAVSANQELSNKYRNISNSMFEQMSVGDREDLEAARKNYVDNVIMPYGDQRFNSIGFNLTQKFPNGEYRTPSDDWVNFNKSLNGTKEDADKLIKELQVTFGTYEDGKYVLEGENKQVVRNLLNNLLNKSIADSTGITDIRKGLKIKPKVLGAQERRKIIAGIDYIRSDFLETLRKQGLVDTEQVVLFNRKVSEVKGKSLLFQQQEKAIQKRTKNALGNAREANKIRKQALDSIVKNLPEAEIQDFKTIDESIFRVFVSNPGASGNVNSIINRIVKNTDLSETEVRERISSSIISHIDTVTKGTQREVADSVNELTYDFKYKELASILDQNEEALEAVLGEKYTVLKSISDFLRIQNRKTSDYLEEGGISLTTPGGLSLESLVSRVYSISRGVVSPRYVATEIALLKLRQKNVTIIKELLEDPKLVDDIIEMIETDNFELIEKVSPKLLPIVISALATAETIEKEGRVRKQITELEVKQEKE